MIKVTEKGDHAVALHFKYNPITIAQIKQIEGRKFDGTSKTWSIPRTKSSLRALYAILGEKITHAPQWMLDELDADAEIPKIDVQDEMDAILARKAEAMRDQHDVPDDLINKVAPKFGLDTNQRRALWSISPAPFGCYFMDQGTGKTPTIIADMHWNMRKGLCDRAIIITKNNVKDQMVAGPYGGDDEFTKFAPTAMRLNQLALYAKSSAPKGYEKWKRSFERKLGQGFDVLVVHHEALSQKNLLAYMIAFAKGGKTFIACDESTKIKAPPKVTEKRGPENRAAFAHQLAEECVIRRVMTGTPLIKRPLDAWSQVLFIERMCMAFGSYYAFKARYCVMGGWEGKQVLSYRHLDEISRLVDMISFRCLKDLKAEKIYLPTHVVPLPQHQLTAYKAMKTQMVTMLDQKSHNVSVDDVLTKKVDKNEVTTHSATIKLTAMLRMQQIAAGFLPIVEWDEEKEEEVVVGYKDLVTPRDNVKLQEMMSIVKSVYKEHKIVIWSRFKRELNWIGELLEDAGIKAVRYDGSVSTADRLANRKAFQDDDSVRVFYGTAAAGGTGTNLQAGTVMIFVSDTFNTEDAVQAEDRIHRIGQENDCYYHRIVAQGTVDQYVMKVLASDREISEAVMGDSISDII